MAELLSHSSLSAIHIEPVDDEEFNRNVTKILMPYHKRKFLEFLNVERSFLSSPQSYPKLGDSLVTDLNTFNVSRHRSKNDSAGWLRIIRAWVDLVKNPTYYSRSKEDAKLAQFIAELSNGNNTSTILQDPLEDLANHCRVCLTSSSLEMLYLFNDQSTSIDEVSFLDKLNYCSCFSSIIRADDNLPQFICKSCSILVENAYQLKLLCAKVEQKYEEMLGREVHFDDDAIVMHENYLKETEYENSSEMKDNIIVNEHEENVSSEHQNNILEINKNISIPEEKIELGKDYNGSDSDVAQHPEMDRSTNESDIQSYQCSHCNKKFHLKHKLMLHMRMHTGERPYMCEVCGKTFRMLSVANMHRFVHSDEKNIKCPHCPFSTKTKWNLRIHERIHTGAQPYECRVCQQKFTTASNIAKHMRNIHENQKTNKCDKCERCFFTRESLRKHSIVHSGLKPFYCPQDGCSSAYGWYNGLKKHIRKQHQNENVKLPKETFYIAKIKDMLN